MQLAGATELQLRHLPQAQAYLSQVLEAAPGMSLARRLLVVTYLRQREPAKALQTLQPALQQMPAEPGLAALAGEVFLRNGQLDQADAYFKQARLQSPDNGRLRTSQVLVKMMRNPDSTGTHELQDISSSDSGTTADMALITAHIQHREFDQALKAIAVLEKKQAGQPMAPYLRGRVQLAMNDRPAARISMERAVSQDASYFPALAALAALDVADKRPQDARKRFDALLRKDPKNVPALLALAELSAATGASTEEVAKLLGNAVAANPNDVGARLQLIDWYLRKRDAKSAATAAQSAAAALPNEPRILDALGRSQQAAGDNNQALTTFGKLAELMPQSPMPSWRMANVQTVTNDRNGAIQSLRKALTIQPNFLEGQRALVGLYVAEKRQDEALALARQIQNQRPKEDVGYLMEADIFASSKSWDKAAAVLRSGQKQANSTMLAIKLHSALQGAGKNAEAGQLALQWQKEHTKDMAFVFYLGDKALERKDLGTAEQHYTAVLKQQPDNALALNNLAWVSGKLKKDSAIGFAERANTLSPNQPPFMDTLAALRAEKGDYARALEIQSRALALQPQNATLKLNLAKIQLRAGKTDLARQSLDELSKLGDSFPAQSEVATLRQELAKP
jgi:putative PEP-CTERM system TPR-repeat lipoprotein